MKRTAGDNVISSERILRAVPVRNQSVSYGRSDEEALVVYVPARRRWYTRPPVSWVFPVRTRKGYELDRPGREVWEACDGSRSTEQIIEDFAGAHGLTFHESRLCVMQFLRLLMQRGLIAVAAGDGMEQR